MTDYEQLRHLLLLEICRRKAMAGFSGHSGPQRAYQRGEATRYAQLLMRVTALYSKTGPLVPDEIDFSSIMTGVPEWAEHMPVGADFDPSRYEK